MCPQISLHVSKNNRLLINPNLQSLANVLERVCSVVPDGTDLKKTKKWGYSWAAFDRVSSKMFASIARNCSFKFTLPNLSFRNVDRWPIVFEKL